MISVKQMKYWKISFMMEWSAGGFINLNRIYGTMREFHASCSMADLVM